ncbi:carboxylesterase family protein [Draconibacterium sp. IB214405]|uniref:carboxylesterase/lipase family protein n=1 Tax=Draconibacterium sp. IB214405 TaxID=3097352 RepID=UPI002A0B78D7|nr:carboxylesterase family protein [Draconibacterium sp. IB214405]MDX8338955.1 carboxylesterase family protein [Draconibacterium sp. IB214405]
MNLKRTTAFYGLLAGVILFTSCQNTSTQNVSSDPYVTPGSHPMNADSETAQVSTESGDVIGYVHKGVYNYKGIPYAKAERFMPPEKPDAWEGVRSSRSYGPVCPINVASMILNDEMEFAQQHNFWFMKEDACQNLNVWSPGVNDGKKRPVMVWLHGGGYTAGSSCELPSYDGENLSRTGDVVVVSINHRLNVLGFLDLSAVDEKYAQSANVGMMDVVAALEWVHNNITNFGGDPGNVTIFGQSGGGGKVTTMLYTPSAKGLFHKAIMQSGGGGQFANKELTKKVGPAILEELGLAKNEVEKLKDVPYDKLLAAGNAALAKVAAEGGGRVGWGPVCDGDFIPFQPGTPGAEDLAKDIPVIMGSNKVEFGGFGAPAGMLTADEATVVEYLKEKYGDKADSYIAAFKKAYPNTKMPSDMTDVDMMFRPRLLDFVKLKASVPGGAPIYNYVFKWSAPHLDGMLKSGHCMEIAFVFNNIYRTEEYNGGTPEAYALAEKLSKTWSTFAHTGNPNSDAMPEWEPFTTDSGATMLFDDESELVYNHDKELIEVATSVPQQSLF